MSDKLEGRLAIVAALLVLFSALLDARLSAGVAIVLLVAYAIYKLAYRARRS